MQDRIFIKGFNYDLTCRGFKFEIGKEYTIDLPEGYRLTQKDLCSNKVFHFCDGLSKVHNHYNCYDETNRYCIIQVLGDLVDDGKKCGSNHIKILRELTSEELQIAKGLTNGNAGLFNSGDRNSGDLNSGYLNSGYRNSGVFNKTNGCNGVFCNQEPKICIFNIQTDWTLKEFLNSKYYDAINSSDFPLTEWKSFERSPDNGVDGELIVNSYETACQRWWENMTEENKSIIKSIPNFDVDVFCDITGIDKLKI